MKRKEQLLRYKGYRCASCGISVAEIVARFGTFNRLTQFHHIDPKLKSNNYSNLIRRKISSEQLDELDKCVLLCDRCHNVIHAQEAKGTLTITVEIDDKKVQQKFEGWYKIDAVDKVISFVTNQRYMLTPYIVEIENYEIEVLWGVEIEEKDVIVQWLRNSKINKTIKITKAENGEEILSATRAEGKTVHIRQNLKSPFLQYEFAEEKGKKPYLWVRNGMMLLNDGTIKTSGTLNATLELRDDYT